VLNHNIETVPRIFKRVRSGGRYERSLKLFARARAEAPRLLTKSGIILGMGEVREELVQTMRDLRGVDVNILTLGQYLRPSSKHVPVEKFYRPEEFKELAAVGREMGFAHVEAGPLVRSSYHAKRQVTKAVSTHRFGGTPNRNMGAPSVEISKKSVGGGRLSAVSSIEPPYIAER